MTRQSELDQREEALLSMEKEITVEKQKATSAKQEAVALQVLAAAEAASHEQARSDG